MKIKKKAKPAVRPWDLEKDGISPSGLSLFLRCREQFRLTFHESLGSRYSNKHFDFGNAVHHVLAAYYEQAENIARFRNQDVAFTKWIGKQIDEFDEKNKKLVNPSNRQEYEVSLGQAEAVLYGYFKRWKKEDEKLRCIGTEVQETLKTTIQHPITKKMVSIDCHGTLDALFAGNKGDIVMDAKSKGQINEDNIIDTFEWNIQFNWYLWQRWANTGKLPQKLVYNSVRRPQSKPKKDEPVQDYCKRLKAEVIKKPDHFFFRLNVELSKKELERWYVNQLTPMLQMLLMWTTGHLPHFVTPDALIFNHVRSEFFDAITKGDKSGLVAGNAHWNSYR